MTISPQRCDARVVNDAPVAKVDAVMCVQRGRCDEMGREGRLLAGLQKRIARQDNCTMVDLYDGMFSQEFNGSSLHEYDRPAIYHRLITPSFNRTAAQAVMGLHA